MWRLVWSALWIQKAFRGYLTRRSFKVYFGVLRLQAAFRGARDRAYLLTLLAAAQTINDWCYKVSTKLAIELVIVIIDSRLTRLVAGLR